MKCPKCGRDEVFYNTLSGMFYCKYCYHEWRLSKEETEYILNQVSKNEIF